MTTLVPKTPKNAPGFLFYFIQRGISKTTYIHERLHIAFNIHNLRWIATPSKQKTEVLPKNRKFISDLHKMEHRGATKI